MTPKTVSTILAAITEHARALRAVGVVHVELNGIKIDLAPDNSGETRNQSTVEPDALNDPLTYGLPPGVRVPGYIMSHDDE